MGTCLMMQEGLVDRLYEVDCRRDMDDCYSMRDVILRRDYDGRRRMADRWKDVQTMILGNWAVAVERLSRIRCDDSGGLFLLLCPTNGHQRVQGRRFLPHHAYLRQLHVSASTHSHTTPLNHHYAAMSSPNAPAMPSNAVALP